MGANLSETNMRLQNIEKQYEEVQGLNKLWNSMSREEQEHLRQLVMQTSKNGNPSQEELARAVREQMSELRAGQTNQPRQSTQNHSSQRENSANGRAKAPPSSPNGQKSTQAGLNREIEEEVEQGAAPTPVDRYQALNEHTPDETTIPGYEDLEEKIDPVIKDLQNKLAVLIKQVKTCSDPHKKALLEKQIAQLKDKTQQVDAKQTDMRMAHTETVVGLVNNKLTEQKHEYEEKSKQFAEKTEKISGTSPQNPEEKNGPQGQQNTLNQPSFFSQFNGQQAQQPIQQPVLAFPQQTTHSNFGFHRNTAPQVPLSPSNPFSSPQPMQWQSNPQQIYKQIKEYQSQSQLGLKSDAQTWQNLAYFLYQSPQVLEQLMRSQAQDLTQLINGCDSLNDSIFGQTKQSSLLKAMLTDLEAQLRIEYNHLCKHREFVIQYANNGIQPCSVSIYTPEDVIKQFLDRLDFVQAQKIEIDKLSDKAQGILMEQNCNASNRRQRIKLTGSKNRAPDSESELVYDSNVAASAQGMQE